jgi:two-component system sensor histidine kinase AlgZ
MGAIIRQNPDSLALPDFRNLGTILRVVVAANGVAAAAVLVAQPRLGEWSAEFMANVGTLEPNLLLVLAVLYGLSPWLGEQKYATGAGVVAGIVVLSGIAVHGLLVWILPLPLPDGTLLRHLLLGLLLCAVLLAYFQLRAKALSPAITEARLQALQARIRPHFLFNSINAVMSLVREDPRAAEVALHDMADLFRVLMRDNRELAPLGDEVELCREYLALEKLRLGERLVVEWHLNSMPADALVPPLVLQPLLENAVYHGIEPLTTPGVVSINIFAKGGDVHAILRNPYQANGGRHHGGNKMAIANVRERLALHFDAEGALESRVIGDAYEVHLRMPYRHATAGSTPSAAPVVKVVSGAKREDRPGWPREGGREGTHG